MKLNDGDRTWLREEIKRQVDDAISEIVDELSPHGWKKFIKAFDLNKALIVTLLAIAAGAIYQATSRIAQEAKFEAHTEDRLDAIESRLRTINASQAPAKVLKELASLDVKHLAQNLPALRKISELPFTTVTPKPDLLREVATTLHQVDATSEDYWPTVLRFIQFASSGLAANAPAPGSRVGVTIKDLELDGGFPFKPDHITAKFDGAVLKNITFINSRIVFTGKASILVNVRFINCAFEFPDTNDPSPSLKRTGEILLASGLTSAYIAGT